MRYFVILFFSAFLLLSSGCCNCGKLFTVLMNSVNEKKPTPSQTTPMPSEQPTESTNNTEDGDETLKDNSGISQKDNVLETINKHYDAVNNRSYKDAYNLRTSAWRAETPYNDFYENWKSNVNIKVVSAEVSSQTDTKAVVKIRLYSEDTEAGGEKIEKSYYSGTVELVNEDGIWLINDVKINQEK